MIGPANQHDSTRFADDVIESISDFLDSNMIQQIASVYADKGYDSDLIRNYLKNRTSFHVFRIGISRRQQGTIISTVTRITARLVMLWKDSLVD